MSCERCDKEFKIAWGIEWQNGRCCSGYPNCIHKPNEQTLKDIEKFIKEAVEEA